MNEYQFKLIVQQFAEMQSIVWQIVGTYAEDASKQEPGPLRASLRRVRKLQLETAKFEGMLDESQQQIQFLIALREQANAKPMK